MLIYAAAGTMEIPNGTINIYSILFYSVFLKCVLSSWLLPFSTLQSTTSPPSLGRVCSRRLNAGRRLQIRRRVATTPCTLTSPSGTKPSKTSLSCWCMRKVHVFLDLPVCVCVKAAVPVSDSCWFSVLEQFCKNNGDRFRTNLAQRWILLYRIQLTAEICCAHYNAVMVAL